MITTNMSSSYGADSMASAEALHMALAERVHHRAFLEMCEVVNACSATAAPDVIAEWAERLELTNARGKAVGAAVAACRAAVDRHNRHRQPKGGYIPYSEPVTTAYVNQTLSVIAQVKHTAMYSDNGIAGAVNEAVSGSRSSSTLNERAMRLEVANSIYDLAASVIDEIRWS